MDARWWFALVAFLSLAATTDAADLRIRYAETVRPESAAAPAASKSSPGPSLTFTAYGRAFQVELESNARVVRSLSAHKQRQLGVIPYKGTLTGIAGSWVRLTQVGQQYSGAIWDGSELYLLAPLHEVAASLPGPMDAPADGVLIFRLADTEGGALGGVCGASSAGAGRNGSERYRELIGELKGRLLPMEAVTATREIEVSVLGDAQFGARHSSTATSTMISRMNVVDGIFASQLGMFITATDLTTFGGDDPFTGTDAINLLEQLGIYRNDRPALRARGLTHLMTGRELDGNTVGIAYIRGVCDDRYGVSLSEADFDPTSSLIIAHELGHNFGAPHDNVSGSACAATSNTWLMNPYINGSNQFSTCSVQQMQPVISAATCTLPARISDVAVSVDPPSISAPVNRPFSFPVTVTALGNQPTEDVRLTVSGDSVMGNAESFTVPQGVTCSQGGSSVNCSFGTLAVGESRQVVINMRAMQYVGTFNAMARVSARVDRDADNNAQPFTVNVFAGSDISVILAAPIGNVLVGDVFEMNLDVLAEGPDPAANVIATIPLPYFIPIDSAVPTSGSCTISSPDTATCNLGAVPSGERRRIVVRAHATQGTGNYPLNAHVRADNDASSSNNFLSFNLALSPRQDVSVVVRPLAPGLLVGVPFDYVIDVNSLGIEAAANVTLFAGVDPDLTVLQVATTAGSCQITGAHINCTFGAIAAGTSRTVTVRLLASQASNFYGNGSVSAGRNDNRNNDRINASIAVRYAVDLKLDGSRNITAVEGPARFFVSLESLGYNAANNVVLRAELPAEYPVVSATMVGGTCTVANTIVECVVPTLAAGRSANATIDYTSAAPGTFTANFSASADADGNAANNQFSSVVTLEPYIDVRIDSSPERINAAPGELLDLAFVVAADRRNVPGARFYVSGFWNMTVESVSVAEGGSCARDFSAYACVLGDLPANATRRINVSVRINPDVVASFTSTIYAGAGALVDRNGSNNNRYVPVNVVLRGDASLSVAQTTVAATRSQSFTLPTVTVTGIRTLENVMVDFTLPAGINYASNGSLNCSFLPTSALRCAMGTLAPGATQSVNLPLQATAVGTSTISIQLSAEGDENAQNNSGSISVTISAPAESSGGGGSGGGGGGAMGWQALLALLLLHAARRRQRFPLAPPR